MSSGVAGGAADGRTVGLGAFANTIRLAAAGVGDAAGQLGQGRIGGEPILHPDPIAGLQDRSCRREDTGHSDHAIEHRLADRREPRRESLPRRQRHLASNRRCRLRHPRRPGRIHTEHPLQELVHRSAAGRIGEGRLGGGDRLHDDGLHATKRLSGGPEDIPSGGVVESGELFGGQHGIEVGDDPVHGFREGVHTSIPHRTTDIRAPKQTCSGRFLQHSGMHFGGRVADGQSASSTIPTTTTSEAPIRQPGRDSRRMTTPNRLTSTTLTSRKGATSATGAIWMAVSTRM